ncbi:50S ribosomal protein L21e [Candidatus Bathyarchaeota archaeon]|nr:MAG: 50S ribosomal protein L21e [Candidatus Bathyarchaeota archaeon ex4484_40]RJS67987.1 MAG: 50S ribosomal protein L21e [Candidatus Bathyarchaeota archaeon]RJS80189.1 MAG: 50S ribosomal protein L21e [Candidatus Bathyarchaeota archaeon]
MGKSKGFRSKTRSLLRKNPRERGKIKITKILREYKAGDKVVIKIDPSVHKGMPHRRYHGKVGVVMARRGRAYIVSVTQGDAVKEIIVRPEHLDPWRGK